MVRNWPANALIGSKCDVFFEKLKHREFRNSLLRAGLDYGVRSADSGDTNPCLTVAVLVDRGGPMIGRTAHGRVIEADVRHSPFAVRRSPEDSLRRPLANSEWRIANGD